MSLSPHTFKEQVRSGKVLYETFCQLRAAEGNKSHDEIRTYFEAMDAHVRRGWTLTIEKQKCITSEKQWLDWVRERFPKIYSDLYKDRASISTENCNDGVKPYTHVGGVEITFPPRRQTSTDTTTEYAVLAFVCLCFLKPAYHFSPWLALLLCLPMLGLLAWDHYISIFNRRLEDQWSKRYQRRVSPDLVEALLSADPQRYILHACLFRQVSRTHSEPICLLEDSQQQALIPVYPSSFRTIEIARKLELKLVKHSTEPSLFS